MHGGVRRATAHPGLGQAQFDAVRSLGVARQGRDDRMDLLVAGHDQERGRAAVGLHAPEAEALLGVGEFAMAVRADAAAGVLVGVDLRGECGRRLKAVVQAPVEEPCLPGAAEDSHVEVMVNVTA